MLELLTFLGNVEVGSITHLQITHFRTALSSKKGKLCVYKCLMALRSFFHFLEQNDISTQVHDFKVERVNHAHYGYTKYKDVLLAMRHANNKYKTIIWLIYTTGLRVSEVTSLSSTNFDFQNGIIKLVGKGDKPANVYMTPKLNKMLRNFPDGFHITPKAIRLYFQRLREQLNIITFHPHSLRKSFATDMMRRSGNIYYVSKLLRHSNVKTTQDYAIVEDEELKDFHNKYIQDNHELNFEIKKGGRVILQLNGWTYSKHEKLNRAINKAIGEILERP